MKIHDLIDTGSIAYSVNKLNTKDSQGVHQLYYRLRDLLKILDELPVSTVPLTYDGRELTAKAPIPCLNYTDGYSRYGAYIYCEDKDNFTLQIIRQGIAPQLLTVVFIMHQYELIMTRLSISGFILNEGKIISQTGTNVYSGEREALPLYSPHLLDQFEVETVKERYHADFLNASWRN